MIVVSKIQCSRGVALPGYVSICAAVGTACWTAGVLIVVARGSQVEDCDVRKVRERAPEEAARGVSVQQVPAVAAVRQGKRVRVSVELLAIVLVCFFSPSEGVRSNHKRVVIVSTKGETAWQACGRSCFVGGVVARVAVGEHRRYPIVRHVALMAVLVAHSFAEDACRTFKSAEGYNFK